MKSLFVMDPLERIQVAGDSTYVMMLECCQRGYPVAMCVPSDLYVVDGQTHGVVTPVQVTAASPYFECEEKRSMTLADFDVVWMRKDPPFDMGYVFTTYLLDMANTLVVNGAAGLKLFNEKLWTMAEFSRFQPETLLTNDLGRLRSFIESRDGKTVLKPWDGNGGRGILITDSGDRNRNAMLELLTADGRDYVIAQAFVEAVERGDKRIILFGGEPVGAINRVPQGADFRANMHAGALVEACELNERDVEICHALAPLLNKWDQLFVGIDIIGDYLTEINVTSPTGIREMNALYGKRLQVDLVDLVESRVQGGC
jgi:glutathione synthase